MPRSTASSSLDVWFKQDPQILWTLVFGLAVTLMIIVRFLRNSKTSPDTKSLPNAQQTLKLIQNRRSIMPKDYLPAKDNPVTDIELEILLEAANWAPTHNRTEPWRYVVISGESAIMEYFGFLDNWYNERCHSLSEECLLRFRRKYNTLLEQWPSRVSHLLIIVMKRKSLPDKLMPEWEELSSVAMSVQNIHLQATSLGLGMYWSSQTWCKDARESKEMKEYLNFLEEDKILGALPIGRYDEEKTFTSARRPMTDKVQYRT